MWGLRQMAGRPRYTLYGVMRGKSGLHEDTVPGNARRRRLQGQCHRKQTTSLPHRRISRLARVKGCGKSAPPDWQQDGHGKPHREQDRIGMAYGPVFGLSSGLIARCDRQRSYKMNGRHLCFMHRYRTRLTGHLTHLIQRPPRRCDSADFARFSAISSEYEKKATGKASVENKTNTNSVFHRELKVLDGFDLK